MTADHGRTFLLRVTPTNLEQPQHSVPDVNAFEITANGTRRPVACGVLTWNPGTGSVKIGMEARNLRRVGVNKLDTLTATVVRGDKSARDAVSTIEPLSLR